MRHSLFLKGPVERKQWFNSLKLCFPTGTMKLTEPEDLRHMIFNPMELLDCLSQLRLLKANTVDKVMEEQTFICHWRPENSQDQVGFPHSLAAATFSRCPYVKFSDTAALWLFSQWVIIHTRSGCDPSELIKP